MQAQSMLQRRGAVLPRHREAVPHLPLPRVQTKQQGLTVCNGEEYPDHAFPALNPKQVKVRQHPRPRPLARRSMLPACLPASHPLVYTPVLHREACPALRLGAGPRSCCKTRSGSSTGCASSWTTCPSPPTTWSWTLSRVRHPRRPPVVAEPPHPSEPPPPPRRAPHSTPHTTHKCTHTQRLPPPPTALLPWGRCLKAALSKRACSARSWQGRPACWCTRAGCSSGCGPPPPRLVWPAVRPGYEVGYRRDGKYYVNNHLMFKVLVHETNGQYTQSRLQDEAELEAAAAVEVGGQGWGLTRCCAGRLETPRSGGCRVWVPWGFPVLGSRPASIIFRNTQGAGNAEVLPRGRVECASPLCTCVPQAGGRRLLADDKKGDKKAANAGKQIKGGRGRQAAAATAAVKLAPGQKMYMIVGFEVVACSIKRKPGDTINKGLMCPQSLDDPNAPEPQEVKKGE